MAKTDIKKCPFCNCPFPNHELDVSSEPFVKQNRRYYHPQCFEEERKLRSQDNQGKADIALFLDLWSKHISRTVNYGMLRKILNEYLDRGIEMKYLLFVLQYVIANRMVLRYPNGFRYYIDNQEIKQAFEKQELKKQLNEMKKQLEDKSLSQESSQPVGSVAIPSFAVQKHAEKGFGSIFTK